MGDVEPVTRLVQDCPSIGPSPSMATQLLVLLGFFGIVTWIVADVGLEHSTSRAARVAHVVMVLLFGAAMLAGMYLP